jgi:glucose-1-phosphate thymidylyltransferase
LGKPATTAVILAGGLGSRMRRDESGASLDAAQRAAAARGLKAMIPDGRGRPFLDHILSSLADGGITEVCLVVPPAHNEIREWYRDHPPSRVTLAYAIQDAPLGTANALLAAEPWLAGRDFLALNADNLYPVEAIRALVTLGNPGLVAFDAQALIIGGNIEPDRIAAFAILDLGDDSTLMRIIEKPSPAERAAAGSHPWVSMNIWRLDSTIFAACREVPSSSRGEFELPQAVQLAITRGFGFRAVPMAAPVLDLSRQGDVADVAARLARLDATP